MFVGTSPLVRGHRHELGLEQETAHVLLWLAQSVAVEHRLAKSEDWELGCSSLE